MNSAAGETPQQAAPTTAAESPATLIVQTFQIARTDSGVVIHFFGSDQPPTAVTLTSQIVGELAAALQDAAK